MRVEDTDLDWYLDNVVVPGVGGRPQSGRARAWLDRWSMLATDLRGGGGDPSLAAARALAAEQGFVVTRRQLRECRVADPTVRRLVRGGEWLSCGRGAVALVSRGDLADASDDQDDDYDARRRRHALVAAASALSRAGHVVATASAAVLHGLPTLGVPAAPELVAGGQQVTSGRLAAAHVRVPALPSQEVGTWFGVPITVIARTVVDLARFDPRSGLMAADAALHDELLSRRELDDAVARAAGRCGIRRAREVLELASPLIESPLESLTHLALHDDGFPPPELQRWIQGANGRWYRVDFLWRERRLVLEADGRVKYRDDALWSEKRRELTLDRARYRVARVTWADVTTGWAATREWLRSLLRADPLV